VAPLDRLCTTYCRFVIVSIALSCTIFELFDVKQYRDLEICVMGLSRSLIIVPFES